MKPCETMLCDVSPAIKQALERIDCGVPFTLRRGFARGSFSAPLVVWREWSNVSTDCPVVDAFSFEVTVLAEDMDQLQTLCQGVNEALIALGLRRSYASPDKFDGQNYTKTFRFGRKIDKRFLRLVDE